MCAFNPPPLPPRMVHSLRLELRNYDVSLLQAADVLLQGLPGVLFVAHNRPEFQRDRVCFRLEVDPAGSCAKSYFRQALAALREELSRISIHPSSPWDGDLEASHHVCNQFRRLLLSRTNAPALHHGVVVRNTTVISNRHILDYFCLLPIFRCVDSDCPDPPATKCIVHAKADPESQVSHVRKEHIRFEPDIFCVNFALPSSNGTVAKHADLMMPILQSGANLGELHLEFDVVYDTGARHNKFMPVSIAIPTEAGMRFTGAGNLHFEEYMKLALESIERSIRELEEELMQ